MHRPRKVALRPIAYSNLARKQIPRTMTGPGGQMCRKLDVQEASLLEARKSDSYLQ